MPLRKHRFVLVATLALLPIGCAAPLKRGSQDAPAQVHEPIRVGAWNIEWLGSPERRSGPARSHVRRPEDLATYILAGDVDILGLEEIRIDTDDGSDTNTLLRAAFELVERQRGGHWEHRIFPTRYGRELCCGIAWDSTRVTPLSEPLIVSKPDQKSGQGKPLWSRPPRGVLFSAGEGLTDFVVVVIHMKSNYGGDFSQHRSEEAQKLISDLPEVFADPDVMIIGDANCSTHREPAITIITSAGFVDLNAHDVETHWRYGPLDRALVPADQPEFARQCFEVVKDDFISAQGLTVRDFRVRYSDHLMVLTEVDVMADDD